MKFNLIHHKNIKIAHFAVVYIVKFVKKIKSYMKYIFIGNLKLYMLIPFLYQFL